MSEDKTPAMAETVSENHATETPHPSPNEVLIAESKKYRKRAQDAESRLAKLEKQFAKQEEVKLKEKEDFKTLYEQASSKIDDLTANAEKWTKYEQVKREALIKSHPEEDRESLSKLDLETLEYVTTKVNNIKPNAPEVIGKARDSMNMKPLSQMTEDERRDNWTNIVKQFKIK